MPPNFWTSSVLSSMMASMMSSTVTMPEHVAAVVDHRHREQVVLARSAAPRPRGPISGEVVIGPVVGASDRIVADGSPEISRRSVTAPIERAG